MDHHKERFYLNKKAKGDDVYGVKKCSGKQMVLSPFTSVPISTKGSCEHLIVGRFYEIDHSKLPIKCPDHLKFIRVVMLSDKGDFHVSVRYPSMQSLRLHFDDADYKDSDKRDFPALDGKFVMGSAFASYALYRRISKEELVERGSLWSFWAISSEEKTQMHKSSLFIDEEMDHVSKKGSCWFQLKNSGMMQWGQRRSIRFLRQHKKSDSETLSETVKDTTVLNVNEQKERVQMTGRKRKKCEEIVLADEVSHEIRTTRESTRKQSEWSLAQQSKKEQRGKQNQLVLYNKKKQKISIDRWSAERYKLAEENMLKVMRVKGAVSGKPILRPALRLEARKLIGDTGLLDHLLKHMAGKVAPGGTERFRRRHNSEGAMEYWLESADLVRIREEAGVTDPYWTPPPGWKLGDNPSLHPICAKEIREIKEEISQLKREMQQLLSKKREEEMAIVTTANSCLTNDINMEKGVSLATIQEMFKELVNKKLEMEEQLKNIAMALSNMEEPMEMLKSREEPTPIKVLVAVENWGETNEQEGYKNSEVKAKAGEAERPSEDIKRITESKLPATAEDRATKIQRLKSGFQICKPQGTFMWPNMAIMSPKEVFQLDDHIRVPTPPSASSSNFPERPPCSFFKPLAERRPISISTLNHVTMSAPPILSPPPMDTPTSQKSVSNSPSLFNLNEAPLKYDPSSYATPPNEPSVAPM